MSQPNVGILVLNWNGREDTLACLASLCQLDYRAHRIIVVDNASRDGSVEAIRQTYPQIDLIEAEENLGFVGGNNLGLEYASQLGMDYALLLNNDTEVAPDFITRLVDAAEADPQAAVVGPTIYYYVTPQVVWSAGGKIDWKLGDSRMLGLGQVDEGQFGRLPRPVDFVTGCALLIRMPVVRQVGMLDPRFYAYFEETEWCVRISRAGHSILHVPQSKVWHKISPESREASPQVQYYMTRNRMLFLKLTRAGLRSWASLIWDYGKRLVSWTVKPQWRHKAPLRNAMVGAILDFSRGRFGKVDIRSRA